MSAEICGGTDIETGALVVVADSGGFARFSRWLRAGESLTMEVEPVVGRPAIRPITQIRLELAGSPAAIEIAGCSATLSGNEESLNRLAEEVDLFLEYDLGEPGIHAHLDVASWSAGHALLGRGSRALILAGPVPDTP